MFTLPCTICRGFIAETMIDGVPLCPYHAALEAMQRLNTATAALTWSALARLPGFDSLANQR